MAKASKEYASAGADNATHRRLSRLREANDKRRRAGRHAGSLVQYRASYTELAYKFCMLGATNARLAELLGVELAVLERWLTTRREFREAVHMGREIADAEIAHALYHRAKGYTHKAEKLFFDAKCGQVVRAEYDEHYAPDTAAASFWLRNRQPDLWREKTELGVQGGGGFTLIVDLGDGPDAPAIEQAREPALIEAQAAIVIEDDEAPDDSK